MQRFTKAMAAIMLMTAVFCAVGCNKTDDSNNGGINESNDNEVIVTVTTITPSEITTTSAMCGAEVTLSGEVSLSELGVCWSTQANPTASDSRLSTTIWNEPFTCTLSDLNSNTEYHVRAYALCGLEYYYGEDMNFYTESGNGIYNGHGYVDLGLPSGTLWATCNVGAEMLEEYGDYFAWGETETKTVFDGSTYKWLREYQLIKYCNNASDGYNGYTDTLTILLPEDDAATSNWGGGWQMPTKDQCRELYQNTNNTWTTLNNVNGRLFTASNGNSLFLPATGWFFGQALDLVATYWSSSLDLDNPNVAWCFFFSEDECHMDRYFGRSGGHPIRAVCSRNQK